MNRRHNPRRRVHQSQRGATLIEVLVSIVIISFGLLGYAGLLLSSHKKNNEANYRTMVAIMASDVLESMRANRAEALQGAYNVAVGSAPTAGGLAGADLQRWKTLLAGNLPAGDGSVTVDLQGNATVRIEWDGAGTGTATAFTVQSAL